MQSEDLSFLQHILRVFIDSSISRLAHSGDMDYHYQITANQIKDATGRQRMSQPLIRDYLAFFSRHNIRADYDETFSSFSVNVDLNRATLSPEEARFLSVAMASFRQEHM